MTFKQLAFDAQHYLQAQTGCTMKRSHVYELLAAALGFDSYASLCAEYVLTQGVPEVRCEYVGRRCMELGYSLAAAIQLAQALPTYLRDKDINVIRISDLVLYLRHESNRVSNREFDELDGDEEGEETAYDPWFDREVLVTPMLLEGLTAAAKRDDANAHYALALIYDPSDDSYDSRNEGGDYWCNEETNGRVLTGIDKEWANEYAARLDCSEKYEYHLRAAGALDHHGALFEMAERLGDSAFLERLTGFVANIDASHAADVAEQIGRPEDAWCWRTIAAQNGDTEAMRDLVEGYDRLNLQKCWTWLYRAELLGADLTSAQYQVINEDGSDYDDDFGGPAYVSGRDAVDLKPISADQDAAAREAAAVLYQFIETSRRTEPHRG